MPKDVTGTDSGGVKGLDHGNPQATVIRIYPEDGASCYPKSPTPTSSEWQTYHTCVQSSNPWRSEVTSWDFLSAPDIAGPGTN